MASPSNELVLVTGGSGFIGLSCILRLLEDGYKVRTTVRSMTKEQHVNDTLKTNNAKNLENLSFVQADLTNDEGWPEAVKDCTYVLHVASPFPPAPPKDEKDIIIPARDGTIRVLKAARDAGVKRVVVTSSFAAISCGSKNTGRTESNPFTEKDWTDPDDKDVYAYEKSKTLAEKAAWKFMEKEGGNLEISVVAPGSVNGPVLSREVSTSAQTALQLMNGKIAGCPDLTLGLVDVRDLVELHLLAMTKPEAKGERFLAVAEPSMTIKQIADVLREELGNAARRVPTHQLPDMLVKAVALFDPAIALVVPWLGQAKPVSNEKARTLLGWKPRSGAEAVVATAQSLIELGLIKP